MPEWPSLRALPEDGRRPAGGLRGLRRGASPASPVPGRSPFQGLRVLLDRLRPGLAQAVTRRRQAERIVLRKGRQEGQGCEEGGGELSAARAERGPRQGRLRRRATEERRNRAPCLLIRLEVAAAEARGRPAQVAVELVAAPLLDERELYHLTGREVGRERLHHVAAHERELREHADARQLREQCLDHCLLALGARHVALARVQLVLADP